MAHLLPVPSCRDERGELSVVDGLLPFPIRRVYWIHGMAPGATRAGHRHRRTRQAIVCVSGRCTVTVRCGGAAVTHELDSPATALLLEPEDWHLVSGAAPGTVLLVLASEPYDPGDCLPEPLA